MAGDGPAHQPSQPGGDGRQVPPDAEGAQPGEPPAQDHENIPEVSDLAQIGTFPLRWVTMHRWEPFPEVGNLAQMGNIPEVGDLLRAANLPQGRKPTKATVPFLHWLHLSLPPSLSPSLSRFFPPLPPPSLVPLLPNTFPLSLPPSLPAHLLFSLPARVCV